MIHVIERGPTNSKNCQSWKLSHRQGLRYLGREGLQVNFNLNLTG